MPVNPGDHSATRLKELVQESVTALNGVKIRTLYLHMPDRSVPFEETVGAINELYKQGFLCVLFKYRRILWADLISKSFGLSNYLSWEVGCIPFKLTTSLQPRAYH